MSRNERVPTPMQMEKQETKCQDSATLDPKGLEIFARVAKYKTGKANSSMREVCRPRLYEQVSAAAAMHRELHDELLEIVSDSSTVPVLSWGHLWDILDSAAGCCA